MKAGPQSCHPVLVYNASLQWWPAVLTSSDGLQFSHPVLAHSVPVLSSNAGLLCCHLVLTGLQCYHLVLAYSDVI